MKRVSLIVAALGVFLCLAITTSTVGAEEKIVLTGRVDAIDLNSKTVVIKDAYKKETTILVEDQNTLKRLKNGCISEGDSVRIKYVVRDGKKVSVFFFPEPLE